MMRDIIKNIQLPIDGKPVDFRLTKLDAFSGAALMQMLARLPEQAEQGDGSRPLKKSRLSPDQKPD